MTSDKTKQLADFVAATVKPGQILFIKPRKPMKDSAWIRFANSIDTIGKTLNIDIVCVPNNYDLFIADIERLPKEPTK